MSSGIYEHMESLKISWAFYCFKTGSYNPSTNRFSSQKVFWDMQLIWISLQYTMFNVTPVASSFNAQPQRQPLWLLSVFICQCLPQHQYKTYPWSVAAKLTYVPMVVFDCMCPVEIVVINFLWTVLNFTQFELYIISLYKCCLLPPS